MNKEQADIKEATNQTSFPTSAFQVVIATQDISHVGEVTSFVHTTTGCEKQGFPSAQLYLSHILTALGWGSVTLAIVLQEIIRQRLELWSTLCLPHSKRAQRYIKSTLSLSILRYVTRLDSSQSALPTLSESYRQYSLRNHSKPSPIGLSSAYPVKLQRNEL